MTERRSETTNATALSGLDSANTALAQVAPTESAEASVVAEASDVDEPPDAPAEHMGLLAIATPVPVPVVRSAPVVARVPQPGPVAEPSDDEEVAEAETTDDATAGDEVAEAPADAESEHVEVAQIQVIDTTIEADQSTRVVLYRVPVPTTPEASPATDTPPAVEEPVAEEPVADTPPVAEELDAAPTGDADDADGGPTDVDAKVVPPVSQDELGEAPADTATADVPGDDESGHDEAAVPPADDGDVEGVDADAEAPSEAPDRPQISVTVLATSNGTFVSEDGSGQ
jgi:hypothetical protein